LTTRLGARIRALIEAGGPIPVADYMALCLADPVDGYYATRDPLGAAGDFTTAPEISQMFGELVGVWCVAAWRSMGAPARMSLVELGPGRGTLMADLLRAARIDPAFRAAAAVHLVETSPTLRAAQASRLGDAGTTWHDGIDTLPAGPAIVVANEFLDALPIRQFVRVAEGWRERVVGLSGDGALVLGAGAAGVADDLIPPHARAAPPGTVVEVARAAEAVIARLADRIVADGGALLAFDYGAPAHGVGDTLQAVRGHRFVDVLDGPGTADLTAHVDFAALAAVAAARGARVFGPRAQGRVLLDLGLLERAGALGRTADETRRRALAAEVERLAGEDGMGTLFQAIAITDGCVVPGFAAPDGL
jgi:SAM-dependent MidA family methyltransferase